MRLSQKRAAALLQAFKRRRILVVGDLMLDRFVYGSVSRISPEAPVPVVRVEKETSMPGGASNVACNIRSLGGQAAVAGLLGKDPSGVELRWLLTHSQVDVECAMMFAGANTIVKERIIAERQQVVRVDFERGAVNPKCRPSDDPAIPLITAYTRSPSRSASAKRLSTTQAMPSPSTMPSASLENVRHWPVGDSA